MADKFNHEFKGGDRVAQSTRFLRTLGTERFGFGNHGPSRYDLGKGTVVQVIGDLVVVWFDREIHQTFNRHNLIHERDIFFESA